MPLRLRLGNCLIDWSRLAPARTPLRTVDATINSPSMSARSQQRHGEAGEKTHAAPRDQRRADPVGPEDPHQVGTCRTGIVPAQRGLPGTPEEAGEDSGQQLATGICDDCPLGDERRAMPYEDD